MGYYRAGTVDPVSGVAGLVGEVPGDVTIAGRLRELHQRAVTDDGAFVWLGLFQPTRAELQIVQDVFGLAPLQVEDASNPRQRAKFEVTKDFAFVVLKVLSYVEATSDVETAQISVFVGPSYAVTVRHGSHGDLKGVRARLECDPDLLRHGPVSVLYSVLDTVVDGYLSVSDEISRDIENVEEAVFSPTRTDDDPQLIYRLKRENLEMRRAVAPLVATATELVRETHAQVPDDLRPFFRDVGDHVLRVSDTVEQNDSLLMTLLMASTSLQDLKQNADMRKIASYAAMLAVPTMIAGIYGMNFDDMPELTWSFGYPLALGLMGGLVLLVYRLFKRSGWL